MKKLVFLIVFLSFLLCQSAFAFLWFGKSAPKKNSPESDSQILRSLTLSEAYRLALKQSETLAIQAEEIQKAQARFYKAFDYFLPSAHFEMSRYYQDAGKDASGSEGLIGDSRRKFTPTDKFTFSQPLFSGFKEFAAIQASGADKKEQRLRLQRAKELLFVDVMESYYELVRIQKDSEILAEIQSLLQKRVEELEARVKIGRSRDSELKAAVAELKISVADLEGIMAEHTTAKNLLEFYIGESLGGRPMESSNLGEVSPEIQDMFNKALSRSDVRAEEQAYIVAEKNVLSAQADLFPTISLDGNYYTKRIGFQSGNDWDVTLKFDVPVFELATTLGDIKEAAAQKDAAKFALRRSRRLAALDVRDAYQRLQSSASRFKALEEAAAATKESFELIREDYTRNLVNNLEVLDALERYQDAKRRANDAYFENKKYLWKFKVALGDMNDTL